jgi:hypothetical protein
VNFFDRRGGATINALNQICHGDALVVGKPNEPFQKVVDGQQSFSLDY